MGWILPEGVSTFAAEIDFIYYVILWITGIAFVIVEVGLVWFVIKYRGKPGRKAVYTHGSNKAEVVWTAVPAVTVVIIGLMSGGVWDEVKGRDSVPDNAIEYGLLARQFEWMVTYRGPDGQLGTDDDFTLRNQLHIPVNQPVVMRMTSEDVIHSFFLPQFRVKQDALPNQTINVWFEATDAALTLNEDGVYDIACAELCGSGHTTMGGRVFVHTAEDFDRWLAEQQP
jgi:cytochrome c oxidase subunit II